MYTGRTWGGADGREVGGRVRVGYFNLWQGCITTHICLQAAVWRGFKIIFVSKCLLDKSKVGMQSHPDYVRVQRLSKGV